MTWIFVLSIVLGCEVKFAFLTCCPNRTVLGSGTLSGDYILASETEGRCLDGCAYQKIGEEESFCFRYSYNSVTSCSNTTTEYTTGSVTTEPTTTITTMTTITTTTTITTMTTSTITTTLPTTTTAVPATTVNITEVQLKIWELEPYIFSPPTSTVPGEWDPLVMCPPLAYAVGFELKVAPMCTKRCKSDDDVALMGIRLHCISLPSSLVTVDTTITSASDTIKSKHRDRRTGRPLEPYFTNYQSCGDGTYLHGARYLSEPFQEVRVDDGTQAFTCPPGVICSIIPPTVDDPTGGQNIDMNCTTTGQILEGAGIHTGEAVWLDWMKCPEKMAICGVRSRTYDEEDDYYHNLGQVQVEFHCCHLYD